MFNITAEGNEPLRFQWMKDDKPIEDKDNVEGTNGQELTISHPKVVDEGQYHCIVSDDFGEKKSQKVNLVLGNETTSYNKLPELPYNTTYIPLDLVYISMITAG